MKKLKKITQKLTFEEDRNKYLEYCRKRNLREETLDIADEANEPKRNQEISCFS